MSRLFVASIVLVSLSGCHTLHQPTTVDHPSKTSHIQELLTGRGGPRIVTLNLGGGSVDALPEKNNPSNSIPGYVSVSGIRIREGNKKTVGIFFTSGDSTSIEGKESRKTSSFNMDADEALELKKAMQQEIDYVSGCLKDPPKHKGWMTWRGTGGLSISASSDSTNGEFFSLVSIKPDSGYLGLSLSLDAGRQLMTKIDNALNVANGND